MVLKKHELEGTLAQENLMIKAGTLRDENPLDTTPQFNQLLHACRHGDLKKCQELINLGVNINGKDKFDYTPLIIASLCGHYELVQLLLESGALAERNTFQGERCIYNALNDRIRNLLLQYDFSKSSDPFVYWSGHISSLLGGQLADISLVASDRQAFDLHKFILACRTPYFRKKLQAQPETVSWRLSASIPPESLQIALRYLYLGNLPRDLVATDGSSDVTEEEVAKGLDKISKDLGIEQLWEAILAGGDRRLARQRYEDEVARARTQVDDFFRENVIGRKMVVDTSRVDEVKWKNENSIFADVLLRADELVLDDEGDQVISPPSGLSSSGIPIGPAASSSNTENGNTSAGTEPGQQRPRKCVLYPAHKVMLIRSEYFNKMFSGDFLESKQTEHLRIVTVDCAPEVLELVLSFLYTESTDSITLDYALDLLYAADMLFLDTLKTKAAVAISTLGSGSARADIGGSMNNTNGQNNTNGATKDEEEGATPTQIEVEPVNIYDVIRAAWDLRVQRLEEFAARYLADRLEHYIDEMEFHDVIKESAGRIKARQETDTIELLDDIRYYLSERFRHRFEDTGLEEVYDESGEISAEAAAAIVAASGQVSESVVPNPDKEPGVVDVNGKVDTQSTPEVIVTGDVQGGEDAMRTIDGAVAEDEFVSDAMNYQILLGKIDTMLDRLKLDA
jgi:hypothetical protein